MIHFRHPRVLFCLFFLAAFAAAVHAQESVATARIFYNARIFTGEPDHPYAEAVAIRGDKIIAVGSREEVDALAGKNAQSVDLKRQTLLPGLIDSHIHPIHGGLSLTGADVSGRNVTVDDLAGIAANAKKTGHGMRGDVIYISGMPLTLWSKTTELNAKFNSGDFAGQAVYLAGSDGHTGWANRVLLKRAGISKDFLSHLTEGQRSYYGTDSNMDPNGFAVDEGLSKIEAVLPQPSAEQWLEAGRAAVRYLHSLGITAWLDALADHDVLTTYRALDERGELTATVAALPVVNPRNDSAKELATVQELRKEFQHPPNFTMPGLKVFADGVVEYPSQTAALTKPYRNTGRSGDLLFDPSVFASLVTAADKQGLIVHIHALGDRAVKESLNAIEAARKANGDSRLPHTLTHVQFADPEDIPRFRELGVIAALQLLWADAGPETIELVKPYLDPSIYPWQYPARSMLDTGAVISGASDWFVSSPNVFWAIYQAETRKGSEGVLDESQRMPREAMLYAYTRNSARALKQLDRLGSIAPGKQADLVLVDRDVLTVPVQELRDTKVLWTMVGGRIVWNAESTDTKTPH